MLRTIELFSKIERSCQASRRKKLYISFRECVPYKEILPELIVGIRKNISR